VEITMDYDYKCHIICIGDSSCGKTTLVKTYVEDCVYAPAEKRPVTCIGVDFDSKLVLVDNKRLKLYIWDTAGQERFRAITTTFYKGKDIVLLTYGTNNKSSFEHIKSIWYEQVKTYCSSAIVILVGTKADVDDNSNRQVTYEQGLSLANELCIPFFETSAKDSKNVNKLFDFCAKYHVLKQTQNVTQECKDQGEDEVTLFTRVVNYFTS